MKQIDTIILVGNIIETKLFYMDILNLNILHDWESMVVFNNRLAFHQVNLLHPQELMKEYITVKNIDKSNIVIYLATQNIEVEFERISKLEVDVIHGIIELPWQKIFRIKDNNGYIVEIGEEKEN